VSLTLANHPARFWALVDPLPTDDQWEECARTALEELDGLPAARNYRGLEHLLEDVLAEGQFGPDHWGFSRARRLYYGGMRSFMPAALRPLLRQRFLAPQRKGFLLDWPVEERWGRFMRRLLDATVCSTGREHAKGIAFWPRAERLALVLTHDVESTRGIDFLREVVELEERYGFRSLVNLVPEEYPIPKGLTEELWERGHEVGVHGLSHRGDLFLSRGRFENDVRLINDCVRRWGVAGFRAPFTHRNPAWMQALDVEYDSSFFDTDPFESIPGGTMSLWPFMLGRFVELPYTLVQDHTLVETLGESTPRLWLQKVDVIERHGGMALLITHPDYLRKGSRLAIYEEFLRAMADRPNVWRALPGDVSRWWRERNQMTAGQNGWGTIIDL